jgi:hypothetical protein
VLRPVAVFQTICPLILPPKTTAPAVLGLLQRLAPAQKANETSRKNASSVDHVGCIHHSRGRLDAAKEALLGAVIARLATAQIPLTWSLSRGKAVRPSTRTIAARAFAYRAVAPIRVYVEIPTCR